MSVRLATRARNPVGPRSPRVPALRALGTALAVNGSAVTFTANGISVNFPITVGPSTDRLLVVGVSILNALDQKITSVTYAGRALVQRRTRANGTSARVEVWTLTGPPVGSNVLVVTLSAEVRFVVGAEDLRNVDPDAPVGPSADAAGSGSSVSGSLAAELADLVLDAVAFDGIGTVSSLNVVAGQILRWGSATGSLAGTGSSKPGAVSTTMAWTTAPGQAGPWAQVILAAQPAFTNIGRATESDTAQPIAGARRRLLSQPAESDVAQPILPGRVRFLAEPSETDAAQVLARIKTVVLGRASETGAAQAVAAVQAGIIQVALETDSAFAALAVHAKLLGQTTETDTAQAVVPVHAKLLVQAAETDIGQAVTPIDVVVLGQATEADIVTATPPTLLVPIGQAEAFNAATAMGITHALVMGQTIGTDIAQHIAGARVIAAHQAAESNTAQPVPPDHAFALMAALETDTAVALGRLKRLALGQATEAESAHAVARRKLVDDDGELVLVGDRTACE